MGWGRERKSVFGKWRRRRNERRKFYFFCFWDKSFIFYHCQLFFHCPPLPCPPFLFFPLLPSNPFLLSLGPFPPLLLRHTNLSLRSHHPPSLSSFHPLHHHRPSSFFLLFPPLSLSPPHPPLPSFPFSPPPHLSNKKIFWYPKSTDVK